jgi:hypothetical protein
MCEAIRILDHTLPTFLNLCLTRIVTTNEQEVISNQAFRSKRRREELYQKSEGGSGIYAQKGIGSVKKGSTGLEFSRE